METWKQIQGYENYEVSNFGNVRTKDYNHTKKPKNLKIFKNICGYMACNLMENGIRKRKLVHRLVADAFLLNPIITETVNHKDGIKSNNFIENLEWMSVRDNVRHGHINGFVKYSKGETHYLAKLSTNDILEIRRLLKIGMIGRRIAEKFNVSEKLISAIKVNKTRKYEQL